MKFQQGIFPVMEFLADLHVHSKFSRATARNLDLEHLYIAAQWKGLTVVGTGDFTHPAWFAEIREKERLLGWKNPKTEAGQPGRFV